MPAMIRHRRKKTRGPVMNDFLSRYGNQMWSAAGIAGGLYLVGRMRGEALVRATVGAMAGAWLVSATHTSGVLKKPAIPPAKQGGDVAGVATGG